MILLDSHALVWAAEGNRRLGENARATIEETRPGDRVGVSAIAPWKIALLGERDRLQLAMELGAWMQTVVQVPGVDLLPIEPRIVPTAYDFPVASMPTPPTV